MQRYKIFLTLQNKNAIFSRKVYYFRLNLSANRLSDYLNVLNLTFCFLLVLFNRFLQE